MNGAVGRRYCATPTMAPVTAPPRQPGGIATAAQAAATVARSKAIWGMATTVIRAAAGHTALAIATLLYENDRVTAKQEFERALELSPSYALGRCWYANLYLNWACGEFEHGIAEARRALDSDPLYAYVTMTLGISLFTAGRLDEAIDTCRRATQLDPESFVARWALGVALGLAGRFTEAISTLDELFEFHGVQKIFGVLTNLQPPVGTQLWFGGVIELTTGTLIAAYQLLNAPQALTGPYRIAHWQRS